MKIIQTIIAIGTALGVLGGLRPDVPGVVDYGYLPGEGFEPAELLTIMQAANANDCRGYDFLILLAIRKAENGRPGREFGVLHWRCQRQCREQPDRSMRIQAGWAAATVVKNRRRWENAGGQGSFIDYLADRYCPISADPVGNVNWKHNVTHWFNRLRRERE